MAHSLCRILSSLLIVLFVLTCMGCSTLQRLQHLYSSAAPEPASFAFAEGGQALYYTFTLGDPKTASSFVFFYGGSGCPSWKQVMPDYVAGFEGDARVFALNKRFVGDRALGLFGCGRDFHLANHPEQWNADLAEFVRRQLAAAPAKPRNVVLVGVSEGALVASQVAGMLPEVTHLAIIGSGAYSLRRIFSETDPTQDWRDVELHPQSLEKTKFGHPYRWWTSLLDLDPTPHYLRLGIPILLGIGERDESVPAASAQALEAAFRQRNKNNLTVRIYPGADHRLMGPGGPYRTDFFKELSSRLLFPQQHLHRVLGE